MFSRTLHIFKRIGLPLYVLTLIYTSLDQFLMINIDGALKSSQGGTSLLWFYGFFSLILGIIFPILGILVVVYGTKATEPSEAGLLDFIYKYFNSMSIEIMRSWGKVLQWSLLLIIPGLVKYMDFTMIPFVVALSPKYDRGDEDALKASTLIVRKNMLKIGSVLTVFHFLLPTFLTVLFDDYRLVWSTPVAALGLTFVDVILFILSTQLLLSVFEKSVLEKPYAESYV